MTILNYLGFCEFLIGMGQDFFTKTVVHQMLKIRVISAFRGLFMSWIRFIKRAFLSGY